MTEEKARHDAKTLAQGMGITFYVVRSREGRFLAAQRPPTTVKSLLRLPHPAACTINGWHNRECDAQLGAGSKRGLGSGL